MTTAVVIVLAVALVLVLALLAWTARRLAAAHRLAETERRRVDAVAAEHESLLDETRTELADARARAEDDRSMHEQALAREQHARERVQRRLDLERRWSAELRERLHELHVERGALGDTGDVRALVLQVALLLTEAQKGLLLSHADADGDGRLDLVCADGFEHDPEQSAVAQHFADEVLERDATVRADDLEELPLGARTPADDEIESLVAVPIYIHDRFHGVVVCANRPGGFDDLDDDVLLALGDHAGTALANGRLRGEARASYLATVRVLADAVAAKDRALRGHANDVTAAVLTVADRVGLDAAARERLVFAAQLHDVGKLAVSERILLKPGPLTAEERAAVEEHPRVGHRLIEQVPALRELGPAILHHHERWDGAGYPARLRGEEIPLEARVICVADAFSAMREERPYRDALSLDEACEELTRCAGTQFDPVVVRHFVDEVRRKPPEVAPGPLELAVDAAHDGALLGDGFASAVDGLTLLYGHRFLHELAAAEVVRAELQGRPFSVVHVELIELARRNREEGYAAGDDELREVARVVDAAAARSGGTGARDGGGRLCLLVPGADGEIAGRLARELGEELADASDVRIGVATWREGDAGDDVIARARSAAAAFADGV
jgi:diguanylate cyclase (GGDEF)-like protein